MEEKNDRKRLEDIPEIFYSDLTGAPLKNCVMCQAELLESGKDYMIEKAFRQNKKFDVRETLFEYAICSDCYEKMTLKLSEESTRNLQNYFAENHHFYLRRLQLMANTLDANNRIQTCIISGIKMEDCSEFQICGHCSGKKMILDQMPLMISEQAMLEINELLSAQTKEELDRFRENFLGIPPEWRELLKDRTPVLI